MTPTEADRDLVRRIVQQLQLDAAKVIPPSGPTPSVGTSQWTSLPNALFYQQTARLYRQDALRELREQYPRHTVVDPDATEHVNVEIRSAQDRLVNAIVQAQREDRFA